MANIVRQVSSNIILEKLNISFNYHSLRHTHTTTLIENGTPVKTVQIRLGHSRTVTKDRAMSTSLRKWPEMLQTSLIHLLKIYKNC
ncbi:tyrosine-type recombinase/integrase [Lysinibacillus sp. RC79]|uniref:tyrosine-type recombinase/integrase n=1 Tax=Lysinibacillus sp. RC79 TaxID=3156296 RepID=UPI003519CF56